MHIKDFYQEGNRKRSRYFKTWNDEDARDALKFAQGKIADLSDKIYLGCSVGIAKKPGLLKVEKFEKYLKHTCFWYSYVHLLDMSCKVGVIPDYFIESDGKDGWGRQQFIGIKYTPLFVELSRCNNIAPPRFLRKKPSILFELSDVIAFSAAREAFKRIDNKEPDVSTSGLGKINWYGFDSEGNPLISESAGYPWKEFHEIPDRY
ncbi:hypothetical protein [Teredinibacter sp. KSP-S5-2]|uniref:hypothetical protein n=1 Tax=Teredinibacter sp. KSP-S5-2 TaxID=3034506 RepID=UPI0029349FA7|nr:hypothetical protein [Teredinibacter sp. KSP-S5-2]WNO08883.1 hypothetical protein P5V12_18085 [Teredinibacter sp. KSP-S5-2]